jgi:Na+/H+ antiporter NhaB
MHSAVGTTFGDVPRLVDNQRNFFHQECAGLDFIALYLRMAPVSIPILAYG